MNQNAVRILPSRLGGPLRIGTKIFVLVGLLLALLGTVSGISLWQMNKIGVEIEEIAQNGIPLTRDLTEITIHQLEQSVNFERAFRAGEEMDERSGSKKIFEKAFRTFEELTSKIKKDFAQLKSMTRHGHEIAMAEGRQHKLHSVMLMINKLSAEHEDYDRLARKTFKLIESDKIEQAYALLPRIEAEQQDLDHQLAKMLLEVEKVTGRAAKTLEQHEQFALRLLVALTNIALIVGIIVTIYLVRRSISRPLNEIVTGLEALGADDMSVEVKVHSDDEIGAVARAYATFKQTLMKLKGREMELESSRRRFKNLVESTNVVPWEFDPDTMRFTYVGPQAVDLFGYRIEDWYTEGFWVNVIHADDRKEAVRICTEAARQCEDHDFEYRIVTADGGEVWVRDVSSVEAEDGHAVRFRGVFIDITAEKCSETALRQSEQRFRDIAEFSSDWIWECDENLRFTYLTESFERITGVSAELVLGNTRHEIGKNGNADWESHLEDLAARRPFRDFRYTMARDNGHIRYWSISGTPVVDDSGEFKGYRGTGCDRTKQVKLNRKLAVAIDARKQAKEALAASWRRFMDIAEMSQDWIWECDEMHIIIYMSDHFFTKTGIDRDNVLNQSWDKIGIRSGMEKLRGKLEMQQPFHDVNILTQAVKGKSGQFLVSGKPVIDETGAFKGYRGVGICAASDVVSDVKTQQYRDHMEEFINLAVMEEAAEDTKEIGAQLTSREAEILDWVKNGKSYADIADILSISRRTVEFHISNVVDKLGASNRVSAVVIAMRRGILGS